MTISLKKGDRIRLSKEVQGLAEVLVGLGWDPVKKTGFLSRFIGQPAEIDIDASVLMVNERGHLEDTSDLVYFKNLKSPCRSVIHQGDNLTGEGDGDDESIEVDLTRIPSRIHKLVFVVNIYDCIRRSQSFDMVQNAYIRLMDRRSGREIIKYDLNENYTGKTALIVGELERINGEWEFTAIGKPTNDTDLSQICRRY